MVFTSTANLQPGCIHAARRRRLCKSLCQDHTKLASRRHSNFLVRCLGLVSELVLTHTLAPTIHHTCRAPGVNSFVLVTKRIIALEGDIVRTLHPWKDKTVRVPQGHAWVEGDEPIRSRDSNTFGPLPLGLVDGRIDAVLWPHWRFRRIHRSMPEAAEKRVIHHRNNAMKTED